jgi:hypothetical protein
MSTQTSTTPRYWNPYMAGALLGVLLFASFYVSGHGLGASGALSRIAVAIEDVVASQHVNVTAYLGEMAGGDRNPFDHWIMWELLGILLGGFASGVLRKRVKFETYHGPNISPNTRLIVALVGGAIMGYGARMARGCTSGQALSGGAVLSVGSFAFMFAMFAGAYLLAPFVKKLWR